MGGRRDARTSPVAAHQSLGDPERGCSPVPTGTQGADDIADHVVQEGVGGDLEWSRARPSDRTLIESMRLRVVLDWHSAARKAEKSCSPTSCLGGLVHCCRVECASQPPDAFTQQCGPRGALQNAIAIAARQRRMPGVEIRVDRDRPVASRCPAAARHWHRVPSRASGDRPSCRNERPGRLHGRQHQCGRQQVASTG